MPDQKGEEEDEEVDYVDLASMEVDVEAMEEVTMETQTQNPLIDQDYVEAMKILDENTGISQFTWFFTSHFFFRFKAVFQHYWTQSLPK